MNTELIQSQQAVGAAIALTGILLVIAALRRTLVSAANDRVHGPPEGGRRRGLLRHLDLTSLLAFLALHALLLGLLLGLNSLSVATTAVGFKGLFNGVVPAPVLVAASVATQIFLALSMTWLRRRPILLPVAFLTFGLSVIGSFVAIIEQDVREAASSELQELNAENAVELQRHEDQAQQAHAQWVDDALAGYTESVIEPVARTAASLRSLVAFMDDEMRAEDSGNGRAHGRGIRYDSFRQVRDVLGPELGEAERWLADTEAEIDSIRNMAPAEQPSAVRALVAQPVPTPLVVDRIALPSRSERSSEELDAWVASVRSALRLTTPDYAAPAPPSVQEAPLPYVREYRSTGAPGASLPPRDILLYVSSSHRSPEVAIAAAGALVIDILGSIAGLLLGAVSLRRPIPHAPRPGKRQRVETRAPLPGRVVRKVLSVARVTDPEDLGATLEVLDDGKSVTTLGAPGRLLLLELERHGLVERTGYDGAECIEEYRVEVLALLYRVRVSADLQEPGVVDVLVELAIRSRLVRASRAPSAQPRGAAA